MDFEAWSAEQIGQWVALRLGEEPHRLGAGPATGDIHRWFEQKIEDLHQSHRVRAGESLSKLFRWFAQGRLAPPDIPTGVVAFRAARAGLPVELRAGTELSAHGCYQRLRLRDDVSVHPGLEVRLVLATPRELRVAPEDALALSAAGDPAYFGWGESKSAALYFKLESPAPIQEMRPLLHLAVPEAMLRVLLRGVWQVLSEGGRKWERSGPELVGLYSRPEPGLLSTIWRFPKLSFEKQSSGTLAPLDRAIEKVSAGGLAEEQACSWVRVSLAGSSEDAWDVRQPACNIGFVEPTREEHLHVRPSRDGVAFRLPGLVRVDAVYTEVTRGTNGAPRSHRFRALTSAIDPERGILSGELDRGYVVADDLLILVYGEAARKSGALGQAVHIDWLRCAEPSGDGERSENPAFLKRPADVDVRMICPIRAPRPEASSAIASNLEGKHWLRVALLGHGRAVSREDIRSLVLGHFPQVEEVTVSGGLARNRQGALAPRIEVHCASSSGQIIDPPLVLELERSIEALLLERAAPHLSFEVHVGV